MIAERAVGDSAVLLELTDPARLGDLGDVAAVAAAAAGLAEAIRAARLPGVIDVIPAACTVLVTVEPGARDLAALGRDLALIRPTAGLAASAAPVAEIPVCYDGPDLAEVATLTGLAVPEVIRLHHFAEYRVGWLGFSPGFGYLTGLDPALAQVPRLDTPRLSVPAGSVAIAGGLAAVYPADSPGGWRLLGRTNATLWDLGRGTPALLAPGMRVRFTPVPNLAAGAQPSAGTADAPGKEPAPGTQPWQPFAGADLACCTAGRTVEVLQPGPLTTVQDLGRPGRGHFGVPASGAADMASLRLANALAGNGADAACLEVTLGRLVLRFDTDAIAAVAGAPTPLRLSVPDGSVHEPLAGTAIAVPSGSVLRLGSPRAGLRSYLAVDGGFLTDQVLGSRSCDVLSRLGPPALRAGDRLRLGSPLATQPAAPASSRLDTGTIAAPGAEVQLTAITGPRSDWFTDAAVQTLGTASYRVTAASNRTGLRLSGPGLARRVVAELPSEGVAAGSLQVSHDGQPILLLADHPTTGGYPVIAVVAAAEVGRAAQLRPGQQVRFRLAR